MKYFLFPRFNSTLKPLIGFISIESKFDEISSLTYNHTSPSTDSKLNLHGELTPSIYKFPRGKLSSVSVSEIIRIFMFPLIWAEVTQTNEFYIQMGKNELNSSLIKAEILATQCKLKTSDICFKKTPPRTFDHFCFRWSLAQLKWHGLIFFEWSTRCMFLSLHISLRRKFTSHPFSFGFVLLLRTMFDLHRGNHFFTLLSDR